MAHEDKFYYFLDSKVEHINDALSQLTAILSNNDNIGKVLVIKQGEVGSDLNKLEAVDISELIS